MASFTEVAEELARQKIRLEKLKESPDVRSELANSVYPLLAMCNEAMSETIIALSQAIEQRVSQLEQAIADIGDLLDAEDDDDDDDDDGDGLDDQFILDLVTKTESLMEKLEGEPRELAEQIRNQLKQLTDDNDGADDGAEEETQEAGNADGSKED